METQPRAVPPTRWVACVEEVPVLDNPFRSAHISFATSGHKSEGAVQRRAGLEEDLPWVEESGACLGSS